MHKISRIYVGNYGHKMCWYDGLLLNFMDEQSGEATDYILQLENGGGKSTLLSAIFSCFETSQNRFLKHLQENRNRFSEYFSPDGLPGFILVEWMIPTSESHQYRRIVIGQVVSIRNRITNEAERIFFSFETAPDLALESVPAPKLNSGSPALSMEEFVKWLAKIKRDYKGNIYDTRNQTEWERHLENERGIDVGMLKLQVEFSRMEGSIDTAFLNFRNETEFLQKFLSLTMDGEQANQVRQSVLTACDKLKRKPEFETRLAVLTSFQSKLSVFGIAALDLQGARADFFRCEFESGRFAASLMAGSQECSKKVCELSDEVKSVRETSLLLKEDFEALERTSRILRFIDLKRIAGCARAVFDSKKAILDRISNALLHLRAAKSLAQIDAEQAVLESKRALAALAEEGLQPFTENARTQGKILKQLLLQHKQRADEDSKLAAQLAQQKRVEREQLKTKILQLSHSLSDVNKSLVQQQAEQERYERARARWVQKGLLQSESHLLIDAVNLVRKNISALQVSIKDNEAKEQDAETQIKNCSDQISVLKQEKAGKEALVKGLKQSLAEAEACRERLSQNVALCRAAESENVDPDASALVSIIDRYTREVQRMRDASAVELANLNRNRTEIETTGLAGANPEVQQVLAGLAELGVRTACAYNAYIAETEPIAARARGLVLSNPARFAGVAVKTEKELGLARKLLENPPSLSEPIMVSLITSEPDELEQAFVLGANSDAAYNYDSAKTFAKSLTALLQECVRSNNEYEAMHTESIQGKQALLEYREKYGHGRLSAMKQELASEESECEDLQRAILAKTEEQQESELKRNRLRDLLGTERKANQEFAETLKLIERDYDELEEPATLRLANIHHLETRRDDLTNQHDQLVKGAENALEDEHRQSAAAKEHAKHAEDLQREVTQVSHCDESFDAIASLERRPVALAAARDLYLSAVNQLDYEERTRLGVLKAEIEGIEKNLSERKADYANEFGRLFEAEVREYIALDHVAETLRKKEDQEIASSEFETAKERLAIADNDLKRFKSQHRDAEAASVEFSDIPDDKLQSELQELPQRLQSCETSIEGADRKIQQLTEEIKSKDALAEGLMSSAEQLRATLESSEEFEPDTSLIPEDFSAVKAKVPQLIKGAKQAKSKLDSARKVADSAFQAVQKCVFSQELSQSEPEIAISMNNHTLETACDAAQNLCAAVADRIAVAQGWLESVRVEFDYTVGELLNVVNDGMRILSQSCNKRLPVKAPYLGGKPIIKMKFNFHAVPAEQRRRVLEEFMDSLISSNIVHKSGTDMVADAIQKVAARSLGLVIAKLTPEESEQYASPDKLSNSGGEAVSMALFLYILTAQIRAETQANVRRQPGGPLILDNPFAKASSPFIWRAQRAFASAMGVQLIFASATKDISTLSEFEHFIYLRKAGINNKTGRYHIEQADLVLNRAS
jgi:hypothetical protein